MSEIKENIKNKASHFAKKLKKFVLILLGVIIVTGSLFVWVSGWTYSDGTRAGDLIKVSRKGVVFKTWEGQLNLGGFEADSEGTIGNIWNFSTTNKKVYQKLQALEGKKIKLSYKQRYKPMPWQGKTEYFVEDVQLVE